MTGKRASLEWEARILSTTCAAGIAGEVVGRVLEVVPLEAARPEDVTCWNLPERHGEIGRGTGSRDQNIQFSSRLQAPVDQ